MLILVGSLKVAAYQTRNQPKNSLRAQNGWSEQAFMSIHGVLVTLHKERRNANSSHFQSSHARNLAYK